jgi:HPt (histidine-containing phosphotransfer) domain-containing protein
MRSPLRHSPQAPAPDGASAVGASETTARAAGGLDALLDRPSLDRLRALDPSGASGLLPRVLGTYVASLDKLLAQLLEARASADAAGVRHVMHTLKSSSASVGALALSAQCAEIEQALRAGGEPEISAALLPRLDAMAAEGTRLLGALRTALGVTA